MDDYIYLNNYPTSPTLYFRRSVMSVISTLNRCYPWLRDIDFLASCAKSLESYVQSLSLDVTTLYTDWQLWLNCKQQLKTGHWCIMLRTSMQNRTWRNRTVNSIGRVPACRAGDLGFDTWPEQQYSVFLISWRRRFCLCYTIFKWLDLHVVRKSKYKWRFRLHVGNVIKNHRGLNGPWMRPT